MTETSGAAPTWQKVGVAVLAVVALALVAIAVQRAGSDDTTVRSSTVSTSSSTSSAESTTTTPPTTLDPDAGCRAAFTTALAAGTEETKFATLNACTEDQWVRIQSTTPIAGATLAALCNARYGLPATSCGSADAERVARETAAAATTTTSPPPPTTRATTPPPQAPAAPATTAAPTNKPSRIVFQETKELTMPTSGSFNVGPFTVVGNWQIRPNMSGRSGSGNCTSTMRVSGELASEPPVISTGVLFGTATYSKSGTFTITVQYDCTGVESIGQTVYIRN